MFEGFVPSIHGRVEYRVMHPDNYIPRAITWVRVEGEAFRVPFENGVRAHCHRGGKFHAPYVGCESRMNG